MDIYPNRHDALILRLTTISPNARHVLDGEQYRLRLETDDVDSESVLQELVLALRDDLAVIGLYFNCPMSDVYSNFQTLSEIIDVLEYILPNTFYPKIRDIAEIRPRLQDILNGGIGSESTLLLYLRWLGSGADCYDPSCAQGAHWLAVNMTNTELFDVYLTELIAKQTTLGQPIALSALELQTYIAAIAEKTSLLYDTLDSLRVWLDDDDIYGKIHRRLTLYVRQLLQPVNVAMMAWMLMTDPATLDDDLRIVYDRRWDEFHKSNKLCGAYYCEYPNTPITLSAIIGVAVRLYVEYRDPDRVSYTKRLFGEFTTTVDTVSQDNLKIELRSYLVQIAAVLYPISVMVE